MAEGKRCVRAVPFVTGPHLLTFRVAEKREVNGARKRPAGKLDRSAKINEWRVASQELSIIAKGHFR